MSLEEDIQQKEFRSDYHKAFLNILHTHCFLVDKMNAMLKKYDITRQQYNVLRILRGQYPGHASVNLIKDRMLDKMSDASRIVERLRLKELLTREYCENDKRKVEVKITPKGLLLLEAMQPSVDGFDKLLQNLSPAEARQLSEFLDKIRTPSGETNASSQNSGEVKTEEKITTLASF